MARVLEVFVDGLSSRYVREVSPPFITEVAKRGFLGEIEPLFAYLGIGATIFAGVEPRKSGVFWDYVRQSAGKPSRVYEFMVLLSEAIPNDRLAKDCRHIISHLLG